MATHNISLIRKRRVHAPDAALTNGPAKVCQALGITGADNGQKVNGPRFILTPPDAKKRKVRSTARIGITKDTHRLWRFILQD